MVQACTQINLKQTKSNMKGTTFIYTVGGFSSRENISQYFKIFQTNSN